MVIFSDLVKYDTMKMFETYDRWPEIAESSYNSDVEQFEINDCDHVIFSGMGGSGSIGDIFAAILSKKDIHVDVIKGYEVPKTLGPKSILVTTSISGNTQETLSVLNEGKKKGARMFAFSSGGKMERYCLDNNIPYSKIQMHHSPRSSLVSFLYSMLKSLGKVLPINSAEITESILGLKKIQSEINSGKISQNNPAANLAEWLGNTPVVYYPWGLQSAAIRFKNSLQENAKMQCIAEDVIEACHNNIVAWDKNEGFQPILLRGQDDHAKTKERWEILKEFFSQNGIEFRELSSQPGNILTKICCFIYLLDYSSIYLAVKMGIDPSPVRPIDFIKNRLN